MAAWRHGAATAGRIRGVENEARWLKLARKSAAKKSTGWACGIVTVKVAFADALFRLAEADAQNLDSAVNALSLHCMCEEMPNGCFCSMQACCRSRVFTQIMFNTIPRTCQACT